MAKLRKVISQKRFYVDNVLIDEFAQYCGITTTGVYIYLCRRADKAQECFPSKGLIARQLNISEKSVYTAIKKLESMNMIRVFHSRRFENGFYKSNRYSLLDRSEWKKPSVLVTDSNKDLEPAVNVTADAKYEVPNKETQNKETKFKDAEQRSAEEKFNLKDEIQILGSADERYLNILGAYWEVVEPDIRSRAQLDSAIKRHIRAAKSLEPFEDDQIEGAMSWLVENASYDWTLESVLKIITRPPSDS